MKTENPLLHTTFRSGGIRFDVYASSKGIRKVLMNDGSHRTESGAVKIASDNPGFFGIAAQLNEYFAGTRKKFNLPLDPQGTEFQKKVWKQLSKIQYGQLKSYKDVALGVGSPNAFRAVGGANGKNPIPVIVPCHRVINSDGSIGGYSGGVGIKEKLLKMEIENV